MKLFIALIFSLGFSIICWPADRVCDILKEVDTWNECFGTAALKVNQKYQGYFRFGKPDGLGVTTLTNGYQYIGEFKKGEYHGQGAIADKYGKVIQGGVWEAGGFVKAREVDIAQLKRGVQTFSGENSATLSDLPEKAKINEQASSPPQVIQSEIVRPEKITKPPIQIQTNLNTSSQSLIDEIKPSIRSDELKRFALVMGNDSYQKVKKLENAREDARLLAKNFERLGYRVTLKLDLAEKQMKASLRDFTAQVDAGDEVVIYYAGHGVQIAGANYLLPIDIDGASESQVKDEAIQLQRILDDMSERRVKFTLAIIDACRDNPFKSTSRAIGGRGLATTNAATGQMIVFSAGSGQQALDSLGPTDRNKNGLFTRIFAKEMQKPGLTIDRVIKNVRNEVVEAAKSINREQVPSIYDQVVGDFYFIR